MADDAPLNTPLDEMYDPSLAIPGDAFPDLQGPHEPEAPVDIASATAAPALDPPEEREDSHRPDGVDVLAEHVLADGGADADTAAPVAKEDVPAPTTGFAPNTDPDEVPAPVAPARRSASPWETPQPATTAAAPIDTQGSSLWDRPAQATVAEPLASVAQAQPREARGDRRRRTRLKLSRPSLIALPDVRGRVLAVGAIALTVIALVSVLASGYGGGADRPRVSHDDGSVALRTPSVRPPATIARLRARQPLAATARPTIRRPRRSARVPRRRHSVSRATRSRPAASPPASGGVNAPSSPPAAAPVSSPPAPRRAPAPVPVAAVPEPAPTARLPEVP